MTANIQQIRKVLESDNIAISDKEFDETFNAVASHVERGEYEEALPLIESSLEEKRCDIRLAMYYMYLYAHSGGIKNLFETIPLLHELVTTYWEKLSPLPKRDQHSQKSIQWFFSRIVKSYEKAYQSYKHKNPSPLKLLTAGLTEEMIPPFKENILSLNDILSKKWDNRDLGNKLLNVQKWAIDLSQTSFSLEPKKKTSVKEKNKTIETAELPVTKEAQEEAQEEVQEAVVVEEEPVNHGIPFEVLEPSEKMKQLYKKLQAFQLLVEQGKYDKAAIIAEDIDKKIDQFNPIDYFPKLFVQYYSLYAKNTGKIGDRSEHTHPALQKLFETDLEAFIAW